MVSIASIVKTVIEPAGILKEEEEGKRRRSMVWACWREKVCCWAAAVMTRMPEAHIGAIRMMDLSSSTRWTVLSRHGFGGEIEPFATWLSSVMIAALSRKLKLSANSLCHLFEDYYNYNNNNNNFLE